MVRNAESVSASDYLARLARLRALAWSAAPRLDAVDVIASPTLCLTPPLMSDVADADSHLRVNRRIVRKMRLMDSELVQSAGNSLREP